MVFPWLAAATAASALGNYVGGENASAVSERLFRQQMDFNREEAQKSRDFSRDVYSSQLSENRYLRSTAHQTEVEDLRRAGLNPILSAGGGGAVSHLGSGAGSASASAPSENVGEIKARTISNAVNSALDAFRVGIDTKLKSSQIDTNKATAEAQKAIAKHNIATAEQAKTQNSILGVNYLRDLSKLPADVASNEWDRKLMGWKKIGERLDQSVGTASKVAGVALAPSLIRRGLKFLSNSAKRR